MSFHKGTLGDPGDTAGMFLVHLWPLWFPAGALTFGRCKSVESKVDVHGRTLERVSPSPSLRAGRDEYSGLVP